MARAGPGCSLPLFIVKDFFFIPKYLVSIIENDMAYIS